MSKLSEKKKALAHKMGKHGKGFMTYVGKKGKESLRSTGKYLGKDEHNRA